MGCNCGRKKNKIKSSKVRMKKQSSFSAVDYKKRLSQCSSCKYATKYETKKGQAITAKSVCQKSKRLLANALQEPKYACPLGLFSKSS